MLPGGLIPLPGLLPGAQGLVSSGAVVGPLTARTAAFITAGPTSAAFERPAVAASFEQAAALVVH